jgi:hypothetical protein
MRKPLALLAVVVLSLTLAACSATPAKSHGTHKPTPTPSASASHAPAAVLAKPLSTKPLTPLTNADILAYCPDVDAVHFDGKLTDVTKVTVCTSTVAGSGHTESASWVNFGDDQLLTAYTAPNAKVTTSGCSKVALDPLIVWLTKADGTIYSVYAPVDGCGFPTDAAAAAYQAAGLQVLYEVTLDANGTPIDGQ